LRRRPSPKRLSAQAYRDLFGDNPTAEKLTSIAGQLDQLLKRVGRSDNGFDSDADARRHLLEQLIETTEHRILRVESLFTRLLNRDATDTERETMQARRGCVRQRAFRAAGLR
jgi:hypothetical protein